MDIDSHFSEPYNDRKTRLRELIAAYETLVARIPNAKNRALTLEAMKKELEKENT